MYLVRPNSKVNKLANSRPPSAAARASLGLANVMNRVGIHRWFMEKLVGIDRRKLLPDFAQTTFEAWAKGAGLTEKGVGGEVVLFLVPLAALGGSYLLSRQIFAAFVRARSRVLQ